MPNENGNYCLKHEISFSNEVCPLCIIEGTTKIEGFKLVVPTEAYETKLDELKKELEGYSYKKSHDWSKDVEDYFLSEDSDDGLDIMLTLSPQKIFKKGLKEITPGIYVHVLSYLGPIASLINVNTEELETLSHALEEVWNQTLIVEIGEDLALKTLSPQIHKVLLKCWFPIVEDNSVQLKDVSKLPFGVEKSIGFKAVLERPMFWTNDVEALISAGFKVDFLSVKSELEKLAQLEMEQYKNIFISPHEDGLLVSVYKHIDEEHRKRLEENCSIKYWINKELNEFEILHFIQRREDLEQEDLSGKLDYGFDFGRMIYIAKYFTLPVIKSYFKSKGFNVVVDNSLYQVTKPLPFEIPQTSFELWEKTQKPAVEKWVQNENVGTIVIPTGGGKTVVALEILRQVKEWTLILVPTLELKNQWIEFLTGYSATTGEKLSIPNLQIPKQYVGEFYGGKKEIRPITVSLFQSAHKIVQKEQEPEEDIEDASESELKKHQIEELEKFGEEFGKLSEQFGLFITDEGHHLGAPLWKRTAIHLKCLKRVSLTATPERYDGNEALLYFAMGGVVFSTTYAEMAEQKKVCPIKFQKIQISLTEEEHHMLELLANIKSGGDYGGQSKDEMKAELVELYLNHPYIIAKQEKFEEKLQKILAKGKTPKPNQAEFVVKNVSIRVIHCFAEKKFKELANLVWKHREGKILVFNEYVAGTKMIYDTIEETGLHAEIITGNVPEYDRKQILGAFKEANNGIIITTTVLDEGIDVPDCDVIIVFNGRRRRRQMIQRIGRGCRFKKYKIEHAYELVVEPSEEKEESLQVTLKQLTEGTIVFVIGGSQGHHGEKCAVTKTEVKNGTAIVFVQSTETNKIYDKYIYNISYTPYGKSLVPKNPSFMSDYEKYLQHFLNYENNISIERDPSEVLGLSKMEELIKQVEQDQKEAPKCVIDTCEETSYEGKFCKLHRDFATYVKNLLKTKQVSNLTELQKYAESSMNQYLKDIVNYLSKQK